MSGQFIYKSLAVEQWALVVFMPDESLETFMTNIFLLNTITISMILFSFAIIFIAIRRFFNTGKIKTKLDIPLIIDRRKIMVFTSVLITSLYLGYWLGLALHFSGEFLINFELLFSGGAVLICLFWGYLEYKKYYHNSIQARKSPINSNRGAFRMITMYVLSSTLVIAYLHSVALIPVAGLNWYYSQKVYPARLVQEHNELHKSALTRYPNSIRRFGMEPLEFMPVSVEWRTKLQLAKKNKPYLQPNDVSRYSKLVYTSEMSDWAERFLINKKLWPFEKKEYSTDAKNSNNTKNSNESKLIYNNFSLGYSVGMLLLYILLCIGWVKFNREILSLRLYGPPKYLRHLSLCIFKNNFEKTFKPCKKLQIDRLNIPEAENDFSLLLNQWSSEPTRVPDEYAQLFKLHSFSSKLSGIDISLPGLKILVSREENKLKVQLWGFESSFESEEKEKYLLNLINHYKSLQYAGELSRLILHEDFQLIKHQFLKESQIHSAEKECVQLVNAEYHAWADCFKDFNVLIPQEVKKSINLDFIQQEIATCDWLSFLNDELELTDKKADTSFDIRRWINLKESQKTCSEWDALSYILTKVEALYRFKWESCSEKEKLALYYLVTSKRINPANLQMLEQLALRGLIIVKLGRIHIVNRSFAQFVKNAEDQDTIKRLIEVGSLGHWHDYRMPITLLIIFVIVGIALTSGNSLYMIVASVMGVLGTIGSLTNSANLIRNNLRN